ncbi:tRNA preQ1(34) S-adenosylmethionine ribosyltransferase-isomerase QueA [Roseospirillum parvum]|uniref:S-adenosylmethionine:tRNA ribosyltransferase-isomerase n=1 Tax=Roseospirillum parvum TaxID=83401 RepID=A0A1G7WIN0_9PROT|nr:tRNA preQ1(34) S-adenosylmethionine ribosyltransferase-isomerase QueA [Roseospirillum parvum]SDG71812.1 S-adenosylmethionine:tRNA ribosyltransferase-isomerase [Roseospirillum parvum]
MRTDLFDFTLPPEHIARRPASPRDAARLLVVPPEGLFADLTVADLPGQLAPGDLLVVNDTRVLPARLTGRRGTAGVEITLDQRRPDGTWRALAKGARKLKPGQRIDFADALSAQVLEKAEGGVVTLAFDRDGADLRAALEAVGHIPLPPYMGRPDDARDRDDYQTLFAAREGAVAAPTAGLHFTPRLIDALTAAGITQTSLTLHVGAGTFLPVKVDDTRDHQMHGEWGEITPHTADTINTTRAAGGRVVAVGTTALRLLESAARDDGTVAPFEGETDIFITPGHRFQAVDALLTNFHLPRSTLFMLVSAFMGLERMQSAYAHAIAENYRFYSYGDACLLLR